jgi:hypothetical protein
MTVTVDCSGSGTSALNPISGQKTKSSWKYFYFVCGTNTLSLQFYNLPAKTISVCVAAPGGNGVQSGGGGGGGTIVANQYHWTLTPSGQPSSTTANQVNVTLTPFSYGGTVLQGFNYSNSEIDDYYLSTGLDAITTSGGDGSSGPNIRKQASPSYFKSITNGMGGAGNPGGSPPFSNGGNISITFDDGTVGSVVSGGMNGSAGGSSWALLYYPA